jgi:transposase
MFEDITELFCFIDDFCNAIQKEIAKNSISSSGAPKKPTRAPALAASEILTILILYQRSDIRNFKAFYTKHMRQYKEEFPKMPTYERFVELQKRVFILMLLLFMSLRKECEKIGYIDSTPIKVCHNKRIFNHKVFKGLAARGKSTMGWFFGFKLHLAVNLQGEIINAMLTSGNCDDRVPVEQLLMKFQGTIFGDKGYISKDLFQKLYERGIKLITGIKKGMKNILMDFRDKILLRKRSLIETVFGFLKRTREVEHTRHRSVINAFTHILSTLVGYQLTDDKPQIKGICNTLV